MSKNQALDLLADLLQVRLPDVYRGLLSSGSAVKNLGLLGLPLDLSTDSVWGATEYLRAARSDLKAFLIPLKIVGTMALCLDLEPKVAQNASVVEVDLSATERPKRVFDSLEKCLETLRGNPAAWPAVPKVEEKDPWFVHGLERLDWHMQRLGFEYDHAKGGRLPRSHVWRPYRFCVQDVILGCTVLRNDRRCNRIEVDVFLTAQIPEYEPDSGCRALALLILTDAYQSGSTMEIRFTSNVEGGRVPAELYALAERLGVNLRYSAQGGISPREAGRLFLALSELSPETRARVEAMEAQGGMSVASVCYALHHGVWTAQELDVILQAGSVPETFLAGGYEPETWHLFHHDLLLGRNALMGSYLDRQLVRREHRVGVEGEAVTELEDDERMVEITYAGDYGAKCYRLREGEDPLAVPWLQPEQPTFRLEVGHPLWVLLRAHDQSGLARDLECDLEQAVELQEKEAGRKGRVCVLVPADFRRLETDRFLRKAERYAVGLIVCPDFVSQIDQEVLRRLNSLKVMRK
jgi:hypothetical protein